MYINPELFNQVMAAAKKQEKQDLEDKMQVRHIIAAGLKSAVDNNRFHLVFMPIYRCDDLSIAGVEVLIRTTEPLLQGYGPDQFISIAEESGLIRKIDLWVIEQAFIAQKKLTDLCGLMGFLQLIFLLVSCITTILLPI